jgi:diacylglycerol kinase (ATP)
MLIQFDAMEHKPKALAIVNLVSAGGSTHRRWPAIRDLLFRHLDFDVAFSQYPGHSMELGRDARCSGFGHLICVGGDGTVNEVVNGAFVATSRYPMPEISVIPTGTGADFARSLGIPHDIKGICERLGCPRRVVSDLGVVSYSGKEGPESRYFVNAAGIGYDAEVVSRRNGFNRYVRGTTPYLASLAATLLSYQNKDITVTFGETRHNRRVNALVLAIGRYFGGGMLIAPNAELADGNFDAVTIGDVGRLELLSNVPSVYRGTHLRHPKVSVERASTVQVDSPQRVLIQADGELLGEVPARFQIIPQALTILC